MALTAIREVQGFVTAAPVRQCSDAGNECSPLKLQVQFEVRRYRREWGRGRGLRRSCPAQGGLPVAVRAE